MRVHLVSGQAHELKDPLSCHNLRNRGVKKYHYSVLREESPNICYVERIIQTLSRLDYTIGLVLTPHLGPDPSGPIPHNSSFDLIIN